MAHTLEAFFFHYSATLNVLRVILFFFSLFITLFNASPHQSAFLHTHRHQFGAHSTHIVAWLFFFIQYALFIFHFTLSATPAPSPTLQKHSTLNALKKNVILLSKKNSFYCKKKIIMKYMYVLK